MAQCKNRLFEQNTDFVLAISTKKKGNLNGCPFFDSCSPISIINVPVHWLIDDGDKKQNYTRSFTSSSMGGVVQLPPVGSGDLWRVLFSSLS